MIENLTSPIEVKNIIKSNQALLAEVDDYLNIDGEKIMIGEWVTIKHYCQLFKIENIETVLNWIKRGIVPAENVRQIARLNNLKLIKAVSYK